MDKTTMEEIELKLEDTHLPSDAAHDPRKRTCHRRVGIFVILSFLVVCGAIAGIVVSKYRMTRNHNTASSIKGNDDGGNQTCNGLAANCQRRANEIMYATVHNAYSALDDNFLVAYNNILSLEVSTFSYCFDHFYVVILITEFCHRKHLRLDFVV